MPRHLIRLLFIAAFAAGALSLASAARAADAAGCPALDPVSNTAAACAAETPPVASLDPAWSAAFVPPPQPLLRAAALCRPLTALFYSPTDWFRLAQKLRANPSTCANYFVSVPPVTDKTQPRPNEAPRIRALGPQMHAIADISVTGWTGWVAAGNGSWFDAGVEARKRMKVTGYDVEHGDLWGVNEFSSAVRAGTGEARANMREFVRGLYTGGPGDPPSQGLVWTAAFGQRTADLSTYKVNLKAWLQDVAFWEDMARYVRYWSQEVYGDVRAWAVPGSSLDDRRAAIDEYVEHVGTLGEVSPPAAAAAKAFLRSTNAPLANAAWWSTAFGFTQVPWTQMEAFVASQVDALRAHQASSSWLEGDSFGLAWSPTQPAGLSGPEFVKQAAEILDVLAASVHASDAPAAGGCGPDGLWCAGPDITGAAFNHAWRTFRTWTQPVASDSKVTVDEDTTATIALVASDADGDPLSYSIVAPTQHGRIEGSGPSVQYIPDPDFSGTDTLRFNVDDGVLSSRTATVTITVTPVNDAPVVALDAVAPFPEGQSTPLLAHASDVEGDPITYTWTTTGGTLSAVADAATLNADDGPAVIHVTVVAADGTGDSTAAGVDVEVLNVAPTATAGAAGSTAWGTPVALAGTATDPSAADTAAGLLGRWDFGDGSAPRAGLAVSHAYAEPGRYTATLTVTDRNGAVGTDTTVVTITPRPASLVYAGSTGLEGRSASVAVRMADQVDGVSGRLEGHETSIRIGASTCSATTDGTGTAACTIDASSEQLGPQDVSATLAGDRLYEQAVAGAAPVVLYAQTPGGQFVVGDRSAAGDVTFWSPQWWLANQLTGGGAPAAFKGFASAPAIRCGETWTASPGFDHAPTSVPAWTAVAVSGDARKSGDTIQGTAVRMVVVHVTSYGVAVVGRGTVVADVCH